MPWLCSLYLNWIQRYTLLWDSIPLSLNLPARGTMGTKQRSGREGSVGEEVSGTQPLIQTPGHPERKRVSVSRPFPKAGVRGLRGGAGGLVCICSTPVQVGPPVATQRARSHLEISSPESGGCWSRCWSASSSSSRTLH